MKRLFLDANVLFTAVHNPHGKAALLLGLGRRGCWEIVTSAYAAEEARRNLARKFPDRLDAFEELLAIVQVGSTSTSATCPLPLPKKDRPIFAAALVSGATHLLTGDLRDFGPFMNDPERTQGIIIQSVAEFFGEIATQ